MSNGVEVIVRGHKTALVGFEKTPWLPQKVNPSRPVTLPGHTISRHFHMKDNPGKPGNGIGQLLQSIVRSATPDLVTKTLLTTFTFKTTKLRGTNTIIKSHEEVVSNVVTQRFQSTIEITPTERPASSSLSPYLTFSKSPYITDTLYTTYIYYNTFSAGGLPMVLTSRETVSNVVTMPGYLAHTERPITSTRVFQTETYYSTYTFSKKIVDKSAEKIVTTRETIKQVVVTEGMTPVYLRTSLTHPQMTERPLLGAVTKTYFTTFTHLVTKLGTGGELMVKSSTSISSNIVTSEKRKEEITTMMNLGGTTTIQQTKTLTPVLLYATKMYFTTITYFTTVRQKGQTDKEPKIHSRTQVVSRTVTEALETAFEVSYINKLKSSYLSKHSTLLDVTSSVMEIIPTKTIDVVELKGTLVTDQGMLPHWPKDDDQLVIELEPSRIPPEASVIKGQIMIEKPNLLLQRPSLINRTPIISSSEEHFDEVKEGVHKIVSVLTNTKVTPGINVLKVKPTNSYGYNTKPIPTAGIVLEDFLEPYVEEVTLRDDQEDPFTLFPDRLGATAEEEILTERPVAHLATPPLRTSTERSESTSKHPLKIRPKPNQKIPIADQHVELDLFPDIGAPPLKPSSGIIVDYPTELTDYNDEDLSSALDKRKGSSEAPPTIKVSPTKEILNMISEMTSDDEEDDMKPPKIYNIPSTFDTEGYNQQQFELKELNKTLEAIKLKNGGTMPTFTVINTTRGEYDENSTEAMKPIELEEHAENLNGTFLVVEEDEEEEIGITTISPESVLGNSTEEFENEDEAELATELPILLEDDNFAIPYNENETITESPIEQEVPQLLKVPLTFDDLIDSEEDDVSSTHKLKTKYTTSKKTTTKKKNREPPSPYSPLSEELDSLESSTRIYALGPVRLNSEESTGTSEEDEKKHNLQSDEENSNESDEPSSSKRPLSGFSGPSKSGISFPIAAAGAAGTSAIVTAATSAFNWKPLLNLGAIGLGGLGVSKLGPLFNSVAGYMKGAILPISRNDTQNNRLSYKNPKNSEKGRRPYYDYFPPQEAPIHQNKEPVYIPLSRPDQNYRFSDEGIIRRPVLTHAQEPNFRPLAHGREPDFMSGPLPPPLHHDVGHLIEFPAPDHNYPPSHNFNFRPPNDQHPNIFRQQEDEVVHKHGDPSPEPFPENNNNNHENVGPEGKTEFITRPLQNLLNGKPMFDKGPGGGQTRPGYITPVLRPMNNNNNQNNKPQNNNAIRPIYKPRPGPASIEMINEIKDSQRPVYDSPQIFLPQRPQRPQMQPPQGPLRISIPGLDLHNSNEVGISWGPSPPGYEQRFHENPFKEGNLNPPKMTQQHDHREHHADAASHESFETNVNAQSPFFNHEGFVTREHFNDIMMSTKKPFDNRFRPNDQHINRPIMPLPPFNNRQNEGFNIMRRPTLQQPPPLPPPQENNNRPFLQQQNNLRRPTVQEDSEELASQNPSQEQHVKEIMKIRKHFREKDNQKPFRPISDSREKPTMPPQRPQFRPMDNSEEKSPPPPQRRPERPFRPNSAEKPTPPQFKPISDSEEINIPKRPNQFRPMDRGETPPPPQRFPQRPEQNLWTPQNPIFNTASIDNSHEEFSKKQPHLPPWPNSGPGPGQLPGRFPSPMNIFEKSPPSQEQSTHRSSEIKHHRPPLRRPQPPPLNPNPPSTVYIVEEDMHEDDDFGDKMNDLQSNQRPLGDISNHNYNATPPQTTLPPLVVNEVPTTVNKRPVFRYTTTTTPTTTQLSNSTTTNRGLISRLFIRRFTTTPPPPSKSNHPTTALINRIVLPSWASKTRSTPSTTTQTPTTSTKGNSSLLNDLFNFQERFKQKYGVKKPIINLSSAASTHSQTVDKNNEEEEEEGFDDYISGEDQSGSGDQLKSSPTTSNNISRHIEHPNHHPIHKPPIDVTKYLKNADEDEFGQLYQGTEDKDIVVDPVTRKIIKNPLLLQNRRNSSFMHRSTTTEQEDEVTTTEHSFTLTESEEDEILNKFTVPKDLVFESTPPGNSKLWWPTTYRPKDEIITRRGGSAEQVDTPTTYRPKNNNYLVNDILPAASSGINHRRPLTANSLRPAPQAGMASFYDDEDSMGQLKLKNTEIKKLIPTITFRPRPSSGIALVKPEELEEYEKNLSGESSSIREKLNKGADKIKEYPEFPETEGDDSSYEDDLEEVKPSQQTPPKIQSNEPPRSYRPSALQTLNNLINKPNNSQKIQILKPPTKNNNASSSEKIKMSNEVTNATGNGHRESSYIYEEEYYEEDEDDGENRIQDAKPTPPQNKNSGHGKIIFSTRPTRPSSHFINIGGHMVNQQQQQRPKLPPRPPNGFRIFQNNNNPAFSLQNVPKTEMEPPPIDSNRLKPPILELPSSGPIRYRPNNGQDSGQVNSPRPNLLRPDDELFKSSTPTPSTHIIASIDDNNKIVGTNTFTVILPSKVGEIEENNIKPSKVHPSEFANLEGSELSVIIPSHSEGVNMRLSSVIKYTGGRLQTTALLENNDADSGEGYDEDEEEDEEEEEIKPSRVIPPIIQRTRGPSTNTSTSTTTSTTTQQSIPSSTANIRSQILNRRPPIQIIKPMSNNDQTTTPKTIIRRPFIPTRGPGPNIVPWARRPQASSTSRPQQTSSEVQTIATNNSTAVLKFSPRPFQRRPTSTFVSTSVSTSSSTESSDEIKQTPKQRTPQGITSTSTSLPPYKRRPGFNRGSSSSSSEEETSKGSTLISRFVPSQQRTTSTTTTTSTTSTTSTTTRRPSVFQNVSTSTIPSPSSGSEEYYEYDDDEEVTESPSINEGVVTQKPDTGNQTTVRVATEIKPTRINPNWTRGGQRPKANTSRGSLLEEEREMTTRYVTRIESVTTTMTETEILALTNRGIVQTQTILITKTIPPETLVSTIVGTATLVNTLDIQPTVVRTTVFSEPTRILPINTFLDTSSTERVSLSGIVTKGNLRPSTTTRFPRPEPSPAEPGGNIIKRPFSVDSDCPVNCTSSSNQNLACRKYANGTRSKCDCKPGYARMKSKYPCRPTFTYELRLGINHMDGMQFDFKDLYNAASDGYLNFVGVAQEAIDKAFLSTDIKRQFQGSEIIRLVPIKENVSEPKVNVDFLVQLTTNITEERIKNHLIRTLRNSNFSIGRTGISSTRDLNDFFAHDFNECLMKEYHDCSINSECMNNRGSFSCKCKPGYKDKSSKRKPGRECQETSGCSECNFRGTCHKDSKSGNRICHCFKWYGGTECQINLRFMLIAVIGIGSVLFILVMLCGTLLCRRKVASPDRPGSGHFMRYRSPHSHTTLERAAIMNDSASSDGHQSPQHHQLHQPITHSFTPDSLLVDVEPKISGIPLGHSSRHHSSSDVNLINFSLRNVVMDSDRAMAVGAVVIPRAKIKTPSRPGSRHAASGAETDFGAQERKLINYLDQSPYVHANKSTGNLAQLKSEHLRKFSLQEQRKSSHGALVSSGEAVSAIGGMRRRSTTALDPIHPTYSASVSEVRSYDETIRCPAKSTTQYTSENTSRASCYSCKPPSYCAYSESHGHTMGDKDGASTVYTTQGKLFRMAHHHDDVSSTASSQ